MPVRFAAAFTMFRSERTAYAIEVWVRPWARLTRTIV